MLMVLMERFPIIITLGAAVLGWTAGEMIVTDPALAEWVNANAAWMHWGAPIAGAVIVVAVGKWLARKSAPAAEASPAEAEGPNS
jgi:predicted tellurium resistance membrane protein TerC